MEWFLAHVCDGPWNEEQDRGRSWGEAILERCALFPDWRDHIRAYDERWLEMLAGEISDNVQVLRGPQGRRVSAPMPSPISRGEKFALARSHS